MKYHKPAYDYLKNTDKLVSRQQITDYINAHKEWCDSKRIDLLEEKLLDMVFDPSLRIFVSTTISGMKEVYKKEKKEDSPKKKAKNRIKSKPLYVMSGDVNRPILRSEQEIINHIESHKEWWNFEDLNKLNMINVSPNLRPFILSQIAELRKN